MSIVAYHEHRMVHTAAVPDYQLLGCQLE